VYITSSIISEDKTMYNPYKKTNHIAPQFPSFSISVKFALRVRDPNENTIHACLFIIK